MSLQDLLDGYAKIYNMAGLPLDSNDMCRLRFRDAIDVDIEPSKRPGCAHVYAVVGRVPPDAGEHYFRRLLESNYFGRDTGAASLACDPQTDEVMLWRLINIEDLGAEGFDLALQDFVQSAAGLIEILKGGAFSEPAADDSSMLMNTIHMRA